MEQSQIFNNIRKSSRSLFYICLAGVIILIALAGVNWRYLYNFAFGPFSTSSEALAEVQDARKLTKYFVTVSADDMADTGYQRTTTLKDGSVKIEANFPVILVGQRILLIETTRKELSATYTGALMPVTAEVQADVLNILTADVPQLTDVFLPYMLKESKFRLPGIIGLSAGFVLLVGFIIGAAIAMRRLSDPRLHPSIQSIEMLGPVDEVIEQIDTELDQSHAVVGDCHLTTHWVVINTPDSVDAARYTEIVWVFKQITQNRTVGILTHKSYSAVIFDQHGREVNFTAAESQVDDVLAALVEHCPQALQGHTEERETLWNTNRAEFITSVLNGTVVSEENTSQAEADAVGEQPAD